MANPKCQTGPTFDTYAARSADSTGLFSMLITRAASFDHLVGAGEQRWWNFDTKSLCGLEVNHRSVSEVCMLSLLLSLCRSSTFCATTSPLKFCQGPGPTRSRAFTAALPSAACVLRYARQVLAPAPAPLR